jgi:hypothetical protein
VATELPRPAFYALAAGGWRDYFTLLHLPYTAWHLSYVAIGAGLATGPTLSRLLPTLAAFLLAVGIGAHALDELNGRPLGTQIPARILASLAGASLAAAVGVGVYGALSVNPWIGAFVGIGAFIVPAYNLELFRGRLHGDFWFALAWGALPLLTGYFAVAEELTWEAFLAASFAFALSLAQRHLSTRVRDVRRRVVRVTGSVERLDGTIEPITTETLIVAEEAALRALTGAVVVLATALVIMRVG